MIATIFKKPVTPLSLHLDGRDSEFDVIYPRSVRKVAALHFTSLSVAKRAASFLVAEPGARVLDIGSGGGKFCLIGAASTKGHFTGVEQRKDLVALSVKLASEYRLANARFVEGNVMAIDFKAFNAFYLFNPFYENLRDGKRIDNSILLNPSLYDSYSSYTKSKIAGLPTGTRLATYFTSPSIIPEGYEKVDSLEDNKLAFWIKRED